MSPITFNAWYCWAPPITNCISLFLSHLKKQLPKTQNRPCWEVNGISNKALRQPFNGSAGFNAKPIQAFLQELTQTDCTIANIICSCTNKNEISCQIFGVNKSKKAFTAPSLVTHIRCTCKMTLLSSSNPSHMCRVSEFYMSQSPYECLCALPKGDIKLL